MIPREIIDEILSRANIVDVISAYIPVLKKGNAYRAVCPFHADTNPSLNISQNKQIFKCFACNKGGNAFTFVSEYEHISFYESVKKVAELIGFDDKSLHVESKEFIKKNSDLLSALTATKDFYHYMLKTAVGEKAKEYFKSRDIDEEMQDYFSLGYSPKNSNLLIKTLENKNHEITTLDKAGITYRENSVIVDRFNSRVIFPIYNENLDVIGFSGRIIEGEGAKYVNTSSTEVFKKSEVLYNYNNAKKESHTEKYVYVVEGFMDVFSLYKINIRSVVALMGTAFTAYHVKMLRKLNVEIRLMLDGDAPGQDAMEKIVDLLQKENLRFKVVNYGDCKLDPDEIYRQLGADSLKKIANDLISPHMFLLKNIKKKLDLKSIEGKKEFAFKLVPSLKYLETNLEREEFLKIISQESGISLKSLSELAKKYLISKGEQENEVVFQKNDLKSNKTGLIKAEENLICQMLLNSEAIQDFIDVENSMFYDDVYSVLYNYILDAYENKTPYNFNTLINKLNEDKTKNQVLINLVVDLSLKTDIPKYSKELVLGYIYKIKKDILKKQKNNEKIELTKKIQDPIAVAEALKKRGS